jgi:hypothetical protein
VSAYIKDANAHNGPNERKNRYMLGMCDDLRQLATRHLDRKLGTVDTSLGGIEMRPEKRALGTIELDPAALPSPKRVKTTLHETGMTTVSSTIEGLRGESIISYCSFCTDS